MHRELAADQQQRWQAGDHVSLDTYVRRYPELAGDVDSLTDLILSEIQLRQAAGEAVQIEDYLSRFPQCSDALLLRYRADLSTAVAPGEPETVSYSTEPGLPTVQLDSMGQLAAQQQTAQDSAPKIPGYNIVSELGRGGMGVVYRAVQVSAQREVALKVVRSDVLDSLPLSTRKDTLARFRHEAHAAAKLEHDNLVPVYDVGDSGSLRFYAMRLVDGHSLYDMLRVRPLPSQAAARYLEPVARGLHFAHEHGVLHRDVKPHNILVERTSGRPLLTDFGLAKFLEENNELTRAGDLMGTPSYMSPEQARDSRQVTASADVYSLGATLYHVLTSRPPFQSATTADTLRQVLDEEPLPPRRLNPTIDRDLETICLKCLQKEPARRYASAAALADDLHRYLNNEPILARPAGPVERLWRWCRRNPNLATAVGSAQLLLIGFILAILIGYTRSEYLRRQSDTRLEKALGVVDDLFTRISEEELLNQPGMQPLRKDLLQKALKHYQYFLAESGDHAAIQDEVAAAHYRVGLISQEMGDYPLALQELTAARNQQEALLKRRPEDTDRLEMLSDTLNSLGKLYTERSQFDEAAHVYEKADLIRSQLVATDPRHTQWPRKLANVRMNLGLVELSAGKSKPGRQHLEEAQEQRQKILAENPQLTAVRRDLAMGYFVLGRFDSLAFYELEKPRPAEQAASAIANLRSAVKQFKQIDDRQFTNRYFLAAAYRLLGGLLADTGKTGDAIETYGLARPLVTQLAVGNPEVTDYQDELAGLAMNQGQLYDDQNDLPRAVEAWSTAREALERLLQRDPQNDRYRYDLATALDALAEDYGLQHDFAAQIAALEEVLKQLSQRKVTDRKDRANLEAWQSEVQTDLAAAKAALAQQPKPPQPQP